MVVYYTIMGRQVGSHYLAMATLGTTFAGAAFALRGKEKAKEKGPPLNATSKEEEAFINEFLKNAEADEQKATTKLQTGKGTLPS